MNVEDCIEYKEQLAASPYTNPELRARLKNKIMVGDKGGRSGQWSARKSQLLVQAYEAAGGKYIGNKTRAAKSLTKWSKEDWKTIDGKPALQPDGKMGRYLPAAEWAKLTAAQRKATNAKKLESGEQYVPNTAAAKQSK
jgi:hypothetical protein